MPKTAPSPAASSPEDAAVIGDISEPVILRRPEKRRAPLVIASPHSGRTYPSELISQTSLPLAVLRKSEDAFVDGLVEAAPDLGVPLILAPFPRIFIDPNRAADEMDPLLFGPSTWRKSSRTPHVKAGLGVIPRLSATGQNLYEIPLDEEESRRRLGEYYRPYHGALSVELAAAKDIFGLAILLDAHSMPARAARNIDVVLGDRHGTACHPDIMMRAELAFQRAGFSVRRNTPYAGGYTTGHYGRPGKQQHAIQIEVNRGLYMDEDRVARSGTYHATRAAITAVLDELASQEWSVEEFN